MTSDDTHAQTELLLSAHNNFKMEKGESLSIIVSTFLVTDVQFPVRFGIHRANPPDEAGDGARSHG